MPVNKPYYQEFRKILHSKLEDIKSRIESSTGDIFGNLTPEASFLKDLAEGVTKYPFRYYQKEAIYTLHAIYPQAIDLCKSPESIQKNLLRNKPYAHIKPLLEKVDKETGKLAPFIGYEMATGSGKTMLMGATVYYLNKYHDVKNFLIVTPSSTEIYKKTIRNFTIGTAETVWNDEVPFKFNLITGDNYKDTKDLFASDTDANIFVFNIDKFGTNATQTKKQWEGSDWKDIDGNTISLLEFLSKNDLVIITDEAHHAQSKKAKQVINAFHPLAVIEFTATAVETERNQNKKNQTIVYKYDIKRFLEDKYGKKVRVLALPGQESKTKGKKTEISDLEKYKLLTFFLVHLIKKKALNSDVKCRDLKPIGFVKVKNEISFAEKVEDYIKNDLGTALEILQVILEKAKTEDTETTNLILEMFEKDYNSDFLVLLKDIDKVAQTSILLHSKSDKIIKKQFDDIKKNNVEIVVFIDMLNEGIDMPNIYSIVIINDTPSEFKTSVKQIVGRGVRLNKLNRDYDEVEDNDLLTHTEKLHIVCDKGASFEEVVLQIQQEFGLNDKTFAMERGAEEVIENPVKTEKLKGIQIPKITIDFKRKQGAKIQDVITNYDKILKDFLASNSFNREIDSENKSFLKYTPNSFFTEVDLFTDEKIFHKLGEDQEWNFDALKISEKDMKEVYGRVLKELQAIPDIPNTYTTFQEYGKLLNKIGFYFYNLDDVDYKLAINRFKDSFTYFYIHYVENEYFELDLDTLDSESNTWLLQNEFKTENIKIRTKDKNNDSRSISDKNELVALIKNGYYFYGYEHSAYDYDKFDSYPEKLLADYVNYLITKGKESQEMKVADGLNLAAEEAIDYNVTNRNDPFWLRNERNIHFKYGTHKYFPDFIFFYNKIIYVIEIKGEVFSNVKKNRLLLELNNVEGIGNVEGYVGMVVFEIQMKNLKDLTKSFDEFRAEAEEYFNQLQTKSEVITDDEVPEELKYIKYVPAYEAKQAYSKFILHKEPKSLKWLKVKSGNYSKSIFATMVKNADLGDELKNKWILFDSRKHNPEDLENEIVLAYHPIINDNSYGRKGLTIRTFNYREESRKIGMFDETIRTIILSSNLEDSITIEHKLEQFNVLGVKK
ncbi:type III restriction enzyme [Muriicola jejuensis]|uniref:DEAD/DEAH box helicase family protein n=1 Tax=Muriicola jejuensis TaxID=504488 RepID=A0A6P0UFM6_9FLAO|nr:DEAD/DEAH box helicase family protein [Muriicola jejuensis]NER10043.1 DEAD/DEAH box helicase family protein [Muriicola jejuensis]SMP03455.1 type III restriction enzyme [Muriicola jejuensis]